MKPTLKTNRKNFTNERASWIDLRRKAENLLHSISESTKTSVGGMYSMIALKLISLESCAKLQNTSKCLNNDKNDCLSGTIFQGDDSYQLNMSHWYQKSKDSILHVIETGDTSWIKTGKATHKGNSMKTRPPLFAVSDLQSALEAIIEIIYQGEGGSECSPFVPEIDVYASLRGRDQGYELSHYYRLREIVNGRRLVKTPHASSGNDKKCIPEAVMTSCSVTDSQRYCYTGEPIPFHENGVWPILSNPKKSDYAKGSKAHMLNEQFNLIYTRLLFCLENVFHGNPSSMQKCMANMYDLTIAGKRLTRTIFQSPNESNSGTSLHGSPTWDFVRDQSYRAGFPIRT